MNKKNIERINDRDVMMKYLFGFFVFLWLFLSSASYALVNSPAVTHSADNYVQCTEGRVGPACPSGQELQGPVLAFSDLISGPDTGLGDGLGSGTVVTVWGQNLGSSQGSSTIEYCDSLSVCRAGHVYYWKNADGTQPSGPANLYESHGMQEIAFSIPDSADGAGTIKVTVNTVEKTLPFTVRAGSIYHVKATGNDSTGDGSFSNPWLTVDRADSTVDAGSTLYIHNVTTGDPQNTDMAIYNNYAPADSTLEAQYAYAAYPNTRPEAIGARTFNNYNGTKGIDGLVMSKFSLFSAEADTDANDLPINKRFSAGSEAVKGSKDGRFVGNYITDEHPSDTNGACPDAQGAAIVGSGQGRNQVENWKVLGNMVHEYGCAGTNRQHHTTYFTIRSGDTNLQLESPEIAYNYLKDNKASGGLHYFDENHAGLQCGSFITTFKVHNNVVLNQAGPAITNYSKCPTTTEFEYYNNIAINSGAYDPRNALIDNNTKTLADFEAVFIGQSNESTAPTLNFYNNTFIGWNDSDVSGVLDACIGLHANAGTITINWNDNICQTDKDKAFIDSDYQGTFLESRISGGGNVWHTSAGTQANAIAPTWDTTKITTDPLLTINGSQISVDAGSPVVNQSDTTLTKDVYGKERGASSNVGASQ